MLCGLISSVSGSIDPSALPIFLANLHHHDGQWVSRSAAAYRHCPKICIVLFGLFGLIEIDKGTEWFKWITSFYEAIFRLFQCDQGWKVYRIMNYEPIIEVGASR